MTDDQSRATEAGTLAFNFRIRSLIATQEMTVAQINGLDVNFANNNSYVGGINAGFALDLSLEQFAPAIRPWANLDESMNFIYVTPSRPTNLAEASFTRYGNSRGPSQWLLTTDGTLTFGSPAAIPEPSELAIWSTTLIALVLVSGMTRRRRI